MTRRGALVWLGIKGPHLNIASPCRQPETHALCCSRLECGPASMIEAGPRVIIGGRRRPPVGSFVRGGLPLKDVGALLASLLCLEALRPALPAQIDTDLQLPFLKGVNPGEGLPALGGVKPLGGGLL